MELQLIGIAGGTVIKKICLEVGHGPYRTRSGLVGFERGAVGEGTTEYDEVLVMADVAAAELIKLGYEVSILDPQETLEQIGRQARGFDVMVSLHLNAFNRKAQGTETLIHRAGTAADQRLAQEIQLKVCQALGLRDRGVKRMGLAVLGGVPPSVKACCLTESFFIDAVESAAKIRQMGETAAVAIAQGIHGYASRR